MRSVSGFVSGDKGHAAPVQPAPYRLRFVVGHRPHLGDQCRLAETFFVDSQRVEQLVVDDGVVHAHTALVEDADDGVVLLKLSGERLTELALCFRQGRAVEIADVAGILGDLAGLKPLADTLYEMLVGEVFTPNRAIGDPGFGQRAVQVEHPDETGPLTAPIGDGQDRTAMHSQPSQNVMAVLPHGFGDDQRGVGGNVGEDVHAHALAADEPMPLDRIDFVGALDRDPLAGEGSGDLLLHCGLR